MSEFKVQDYLRSLYGPGAKAGIGVPAPLPQRVEQLGDKRGRRGGPWT